MDYSGVNHVTEPEPQTPRERLDNAILSAHTGVKVLRIGAIAIAAGGLIAGYAQWQQYSNENFGSPSMSNWMKLGFIFQPVASIWAYAGLVLAASYLLALYAAKAEVQITTPPPTPAAIPFSLNLQTPPANAAPVAAPLVDPRVWQPSPPPGTDTEASWRPASE